MHQVEASLIESRYVNYDILMQQMGQMLEKNGVPPSATPDMAKVSTPIRPFVVPTSPDVVLKGGETFRVGTFEFEVINSPGHSPGHICLYEKTKKMLFSGDHVLLDITPNVSFHPQSGDNPLKDFLDSLERLAELDVNFVFPGHGPVFSGLRQRIGQIVYHHEQRQLYIKSAARDELKTAWEIANTLQWGSNRSVPFSKLAMLHQRLAVMETIAHLQFLVAEDKAKRVLEGETVKYYTGG
jgi:glyoxylase-like metal-dependent hydrolase (beta-lactamase superfamily II)